MNKVTVLFFATLKERAGSQKTNLELEEGSRVKDLKLRLAEQYPGMVDHLPNVVVSVNREFAFDDDLIPPGAEVALFPPVSGGTDEAIVLPSIFAITEDHLDLNAILASITLPSTGAACFFTGMVRGITRRDLSHETDYLEYEAYQTMAEAKLRQVADEIRERWPKVEGIAVIQRVGRLYPGTPTVLIACTAAHRDTGVFEAARYGIDRLKEIVPIWKKEFGPDGTAWVEGDYVPRPKD